MAPIARKSIKNVSNTDKNYLQKNNNKEYDNDDNVHEQLLYTTKQEQVYIKGYLTSSHAWLMVFIPAFIFFYSKLSATVNSRDVTGSIERLIPEKFDKLVPKDAKIHVMSQGYKWAEGPLWWEGNEDKSESSYLLFSDVKSNRIWKWEEGEGMFLIGRSLFLDDSGCADIHNNHNSKEFSNNNNNNNTNNHKRCQNLIEPGSNGLAREPNGYDNNNNNNNNNNGGNLIMCEHGDRRVTKLLSNGTKVVLASHYDGKKLNSPNDLIFSPTGDIYFTDPTYGLNKKENDSNRELSFNGVYRIPAKTIADATAGRIPDDEFPKIELLVKDLARPNGIGISPDFSRMYIAVSERANPRWMLYDITDEGTLENEREFLHAAQFQKGGERTGSPDGLAIDEHGNLWATGPGGVLVFTPEGEHLGTILTGKKTGNCALGGDGYLYITSDDVILRVQVSVKALKISQIAPY